MSTQEKRGKMAGAVWLHSSKFDVCSRKPCHASIIQRSFHDYVWYEVFVEKETQQTDRKRTNRELEKELLGLFKE